MTERQEHDVSPDAGEALDEIRRFTWAAADVTAAQERIITRLDQVKGEITSTHEALTRANDLAQRLAQRGMSIDRSDMEALRGERAALVEAMHESIGEADRIREKFWMGAFGLGICGGVIGGGVAIAVPVIIRGFVS